VRLKPLLATAATLIATSATFATAGTAPAAGVADPANVSDFLAGQLTRLTGSTTVLVHGSSLDAARQAVAATGMKKKGEFRGIDVVVATGSKSQIQAVRSQPGVTYVEGGAQPIEFFQETSNTATRGAEAAATLTGADGTPLTGKGVSVAVIDSGVDPTHPYFKEADGSSAVVANLKALCEPLT
jgi:serine protease AprX